MNRAQCKCYYEDCQKTFQNRIYLITHLNLHHLQSKVIRCELCNSYFNSEVNYLNHKAKCIQVQENIIDSSGLLSKFRLSDEQEYIPPDISALPTLPSIEPERTRNAFQYKIPLSVRIFECLSIRPESERK